MVMSMHRNPGKTAASNDDLIQSISPVFVYFFIWNCSNMGHPTTMNPWSPVPLLETGMCTLITAWRDPRCVGRSIFHRKSLRI